MGDNDMDEFVKNMEDDILDDDQLNDMIPDSAPPPPKKNLYQENIKKQPVKRQVQQVNQQVNQQRYRQQPINGYINNTQIPQQNNVMYQEDLVNGNYPQINQTNSKFGNITKMLNFGALKLPILVLVLYVILTLPITSDMMGTYVPLLKPGLVGTLIKGVVLAIIVLVMNKLF
jgi:hypothetical protein